MTVKDLIYFLSTQRQDLPVVYRVCSEQALLERKDISVEKLCIPRPDGWVANARPDKELIEYLVLPGN